jgi:hypothetical protein
VVTRTAIAAIVLWGCYGPHAAVGVPCAANGDCPGGQTCDVNQTPPTCVAGGSAGADAPIADGGIDAPPACTDDSMCAAGDPICDPSTHTCRGCVADAECASPSGVCIESSGSCVDDSAVVFLAPGGTDAGACPRSAPCATFAYVFTQLSPTITTVRVGDGSYAEAVHLTTTTGAGTAQVALSGETRDPSRATLTAVSSPLMLFDTSTNALLEGMTIANSIGDGIDSRSTLVVSRVAVTNCSGAAINANAMTSGGGLRVLDSALTASGGLGVISGKGTVDLERDVVVGNLGGGVRTSQGPITILNTIIADNGSTSSNVGGLRMDNLTVAGSRLELDTVAYNVISGGLLVTAGVQAGNQITVTNMILADNGPSGTAQMSSNVSVTHSLFEAGPQPQGMGNKTGSPAFKDVMNGDFHITAGSMAIDNAGATTITDDVDGESRPYGAGPDMGADEYHP